MNYDRALSKINGAISLPQMDRSTYANDFETIRNEIINKLKAADSLFDQLYSGTCIAGSYADNLKISKPDEFDLLICLKLRENSKVIISRSPNMPGYVRINMLPALEKMKFEKQNKLFWERFQKYINSDGYLIQDKIHSWVESLMTKILQDCNNYIKNGNKIYNIKYTKAGPAHTLNVNNKNFSIDFVPAFVFTKKQWAAERLCPINITSDDAEWFAVPKPLKGQQKLNSNGQNLNFIASFNKIERRLIAKKDNLKNTLKMLKKIRDRLNIQNLKSYFIKTIYLWENEKQSSDFWQQSTTLVLMHMFEILCNSVKNGEILFFWDKGHNMLQPLGQNQLNNMHGQLRKVFDDLNKSKELNPDIIYNVFLTDEEKFNLSINIFEDDVVDDIDRHMKTIKITATDKCNFGGGKEKNNLLSATTKTSSPSEEHATEILKEIQKFINDSTLSNVEKIKEIQNKCKTMDSNSHKIDRQCV